MVPDPSETVGRQQAAHGFNESKAGNCTVRADWHGSNDPAVRQPPNQQGAVRLEGPRAAFDSLALAPDSQRRQCIHIKTIHSDNNKQNQITQARLPYCLPLQRFDVRWVRARLRS